MDRRGRDGESQRVASGVEAAVSDAVAAEMMTSEEQGMTTEVTNERVARGLETAEREGIASEEDVQALALANGERQKEFTEREAAAIFSQERIENEVARETGLKAGENVEQPGVETERLAKEWQAEDNYDLATEQGKNGREPQQILLATMEDFAKEAQKVRNQMTNAADYAPARLDQACWGLREKVLERYGSDLGDRN